MTSSTWWMRWRRSRDADRAGRRAPPVVYCTEIPWRGIMADARAAGIHWRTGPAPDGRDGADDPIFDVLDSSSPTLLNEPEAQWHWAAVAEKRSGLTVWRSSP